MSTIKLYRHPLSGHSHRVELLISLLGLDADIIDVDLMKGEHKQPKFLAMNSQGQVPVLQVGDSFISDSNAILTYIASKYDTSGQWLPSEPTAAAEVQQMLTLAASSLASGPATARLINVFGAGYDAEAAIAIAHTLFKTLEARLENRDWLASNHATIADVALYAYIARAPEGDVSLADYPRIRSWLARVEDLPGFVPMQKTAVGLAA